MHKKVPGTISVRNSRLELTDRESVVLSLLKLVPAISGPET